MPRLKLTVSYMGSRFNGWQLQPGCPTVQGELERALEKVTGRPTRVQGSGRTDSGVHAIGQVAHADVPEEKAHLPWIMALNAHLPGGISVIDARIVPETFHARFSSFSKAYTYSIWTERAFLFPQRKPFVWKCGHVDLAAMDECARLFTGEHDFASFMNVGTPVNSTVRTVYEFYREPACAACTGRPPFEVTWRIRANGFLKQMVRNIMGCMVEVGRGKLGLDDVRAIMERRDRSAAPATAPAAGLTLERVDYGEDGLGKPVPPRSAAPEEDGEE